MKKILALILTVTLIFSIVPLCVSAQGEDTTNISTTTAAASTTTTTAAATTTTTTANPIIDQLVESILPEGASAELTAFVYAEAEIYYSTTFAYTNNHFATVDDEIAFIKSFYESIITAVQKEKDTYQALSDDDIILLVDGDEEYVSEFRDMIEGSFTQIDEEINTSVKPLIKLMENKEQFKSDYNLINQITDLLFNCSTELTDAYLNDVWEDYNLGIDNIDDYTYTDIEAGGNNDVTVSTDEAYILIRFIPETTDSYVFKSTGDYDTFCDLYDAEGNYIKSNEDTSEDNYNFCFSYEFKAGETYYFGVSASDIYFGEVESCTFNVSLYKGTVEEYINEDIYDHVTIEKYSDINTDVVTNVALTQDVNTVYYRFIPKSTDSFVFKSIGDYNTTCFLYDADGNYLADYYSDYDCNFKFSYEFEAGKVYYLAVSCDGINYIDSCAFDVFLYQGEWEYEDIYDKVTINKYSDINAGATSAVNLSVKDDIKYFRFIPGTSDSYAFKSIGTYDTYCILYDSEGNYIADNDDNQNSFNFSFSAELDAGETYYFGVYSYDVPCSFSVNVYKGEIEQWDIYSHVDISKYTNIAAGNVKAATVSTNENMVFYRFIPQTSESYAFKSTGDYDTYCILYDANGDYITDYDDNNNINFSFSTELEAGKTYYIGVSTNDIYELKTCTFNVTVFKGEIEQIDIYDHVAISEYTDISPDDVKTVTVNDYYDMEFFRFVPTTTASYVFKSTGDCDTSCVLYDADGNYIRDNQDSSGEDYNFTFCWELEAGKTYYFGVRGNGDHRYYDYSTSFTFDVTLYQGEVEEYIHQEIYGHVTIDEYTDIAPDDVDEVTLDGYDDIKFFRFVPETTDYYVFKSTGDYDTTCILYDADGNYIRDNDDSSYDDCNFTFCEELEAGETYYFGVVGYSFMSGYDYSLDSVYDETLVFNVTLYQGEVEEYIREDIYDHVTINDSTDIAVDGTAHVTVDNSSSELSFFRFVPETTESYAIKSTGDADTYCIVYDSDGYYIMDNEDSSENDYNFALSMEFVAGETYYFGVGGYSNDYISDSCEFDISLYKGVVEEGTYEDEYDHVTINESTDAAMDTVTKVTVAEESGMVYYRLSPQTTQSYMFYSTGFYDTYCFLYDADGNYLTDSDDCDADMNFLLCSELEAGKTYYLGIGANQAFKTKSTVTFDVSISQGDEQDAHDLYLNFLDLQNTSFILKFFIDPDNISQSQYENLLAIKSKAALLSDDMLTWLEAYGFSSFLEDVDEYIATYEAKANIKFGDCNDDGIINLKDSLLLKQCVANWEVTINKAAADTNYDGLINSKDSLLLKQYIANWEVELG